MFNGDNACPLKCPNEIDSQEHMLVCDGIISHLNINQKENLDNVKYEHIFGNNNEKLKITQVFQVLLKIRERLLERDQGPACLGNSTGPCG